jgi:hypothetical protein
VYSDWLQWVLCQVAEVDSRLIGQILRSPNWKRFANSQNPVAVDREVPVAHGYNDQTGRLDLVIRRGTEWLAVVEIKTRGYSDFDLAKHKGYRDSIAPSADLILISVDPPDKDPGGFRFLSWADVCITLRGIAPRLLSSEVLSTAMILSFVGAVEQNLLGFRLPEEIRMSIGKVPRMIDHLMKVKRREPEFGDP